LEVKAHDAKSTPPPSAPVAPRPNPGTTPSQPSFDSRYDSHQPRSQGGKGQGARTRTPSPSPGTGRGDRGRPTSPRRGPGGKGSGGGKGSAWNNSPGAKGGKGQDKGKGGPGQPPSFSQSRGSVSPSHQRPCYCCGGEDHWARECPNRWCQFCLKLGHTTRECTKAPADQGQGAPRTRDTTPPRQASS
jgi:hypothetical protein